MSLQLIEPFNPLSVEPSSGATQLQVGRHPVVIVGGAIDATKDNTGGLLRLDLQVIDGPQKGASSAYRLNLYNQSEKAKEIARSQLSALCHVLGVFNLGAMGTDVSVLFNLPFIVEVTPQADAQYTQISKVLDINGNPAKAQGQQAAQPQAANGFGAQPQQFAAQPAQQAPAAAWGQPQQTEQVQQVQQAPAAAWGQPQPQGAQPAANGAAPAWARPK